MTLAWLAIGLAAAQVTLPVPPTAAQVYRLPADASRTLWADEAGMVATGAFASTYLAYANNPLSIHPQGGDPIVLVEDVLTATGTIGFTNERVRVSMDIPAYVFATGPALDGPPGIGDLAVEGKYAATPEATIRLAGLVRGTLPTATKEGSSGAPKSTADLLAVADIPLGPSLIALNVGHRFQPPASDGLESPKDVLLLRAGAGTALNLWSGLSADVAGSIAYNDSAASHRPFEAMAGGWLALSHTMIVRGGAGTGLSTGIGAPAFRALVAVNYQPGAQQSHDIDGDGLFDKHDSCRFDAEDVDGYLDDDGCPEVDNDGDGVLDGTDNCPLVPEDLDGWMDEDGCPDPRTHVSITAIVEGEIRIVGSTLELIGGDRTYAGTDGLEADIPPGTYILRASAPEFAPVETEIVVAPGPLVARMISLGRDPNYVPVRLQVEGLAGDPVNPRWSWESGTLIAVGNGVAVLPGDYAVELVSDGTAPVQLVVEVREDRMWEIRPAFGSYSVELTDDDLEGNYSVDLVHGGSFSVEFVDDVGPVGAYTVVLAPDVGTVQLEVVARAGNARVDEATIWTGPDQNLTAPEGAVEFDLLAGGYDLSVLAPGFAPRIVPFNVVGGETRRLVIQLDRPRVVIDADHLAMEQHKSFFPSGSAVLNSSSFEMLDEIAVLIKTHQELGAIRVEGHADRRGSKSFNLELSQQRARSVVKYLSDRGVDEERLHADARGEDAPLTEDADEYSLSLNRRVEFRLARAEGPTPEP